MAPHNALPLVASALIAFAAGAQELPETVYGKFHRALVAGNLEEMLRYAPAARRAEVAALPEAQKRATLEFMRRLMPKTHTVTGKQVSPDGNRATLRATGPGTSLIGGKPETQYGTIAMLKEGGEWKVDQSTWDNNPKDQPAPSPSAATPATRAQSYAPPAARATAPPPVKRSDEAKRRATVRQPGCEIKPVMTEADLARCR